MNGAFFAKTAILFKFNPVGIVLLVLCGVVVALLAFCALKRYSHIFRFHFVLRKVAKFAEILFRKENTDKRCFFILPQPVRLVKRFSILLLKKKYARKLYFGVLALSIVLAKR